MADAILKAALEWAELNVPVFPCADNKAPLTERGHLDASTDPMKVTALFEFAGKRAKYIGARMGEESGLFAMDFDLYKGESPQNYMDGLIKDGLLPETRTHKTKSGGLHLIYKSDTAWPNCKPVDGVEVKGEGGYIIVPPSEGYVVERAGVVTAPPALLASLQRSKQRSATVTNTDLKQAILDGDDFHDSLTRLAARRAADGWDNARIQGEIMETLNASVASSAHHERHARWLSIVTNKSGELSRMVASGYKKFNTDSASEAVAENVATQVRTDVANSMFASPPIVGEEAVNHKATEYADDEWPFTAEEGAFAHEERDIFDQEFAMYPLYAENETVLIYAEPKTGKTALALTTALHIACGMDFGSFAVAEAGPVLYYGLEGKVAIQRRVAAWKRRQHDLGNKLPAQIPMYTVEKHINFLKDDMRQDAANQIVAADRYSKNRGTKLKVIFIDTLTKAMAGGDQNSVEDTSHLFELVSMLRTSGVTATIVFVHHAAKTGGARGSSNIEAEPDVVIHVAKEGSAVKLSVPRARSIEDGISFHFTLHGYVLGKTKQGHEISGVYVEPQEGETASQGDKASDAVVHSAATRTAMSTIVGLGAGKHDLIVVLKALQELKLIPEPTRTTRKARMRKLDPKAGYLQKFICDLVTVNGTLYGDYAVRRIGDGKVSGLDIKKI